MKKAETEVLGWLIIIALIIYPFVWLHGQIGGLGIGVLVALLIGAGIYRHIRSERKDQEAFDKLVFYVLHNRIPPDEAKKINQNLSKSNFPRSALIRNLQIISDSIEIALTSKKRETAESRMDTVLELFEKINQEQSALITAETLEEIARVVQKAERNFYTKLFTNLALGHLEKVEKLKTQKSKAKYLQLAREVLREGLDLGRGHKIELKKTLAQVERAEQNLSNT